MKEIKLYTRDNKIYVCLKEIRYIVYDFGTIQHIANEYEFQLGNKHNKKVIGDDEYIELMKKGLRMCKSFILIGINLDKNSIEDEIESLKYKEIFKDSEIEFEENDYLYKEQFETKKNEIIIESDISLYTEAKIGIDGYSKYSIIINRKIQKFKIKAECKKNNLTYMIRNQIKELNKEGTLSYKIIMQMCFKSSVNEILIALSLDVGIEKANEWYLKQLNDYKINMLLNKI